MTHEEMVVRLVGGLVSAQTPMAAMAAVREARDSYVRLCLEAGTVPTERMLAIFRDVMTNGE